MSAQDQILKDAQDKFIEGISNIGKNWGINSVEAKIIGLLIAEIRPVSLNSIMESLMISKGNISIAIRKLEEKQFVKKVWIKGDRKDYYEATVDIWHIFLKKMYENFRYESINALSTIDNTIKIIQGSFNKMSNEASDQARNFMQKLQKMKTYYSLADEIGKNIENDIHFDLPRLRVLWNSIKLNLKQKS